MTTLCRLRIEVPDSPGSLAAVAAVLADHDANIIDVAVHEVSGFSAIDEIVVTTPPDWEPPHVQGALAAVGATLVSSAPCDSLVDPVVGALSLVARLLHPGADWRASGAALLGHAAAAPAAAVVDAAEVRDHDVVAAATARGTPVIVRTARLPESMAAQGGQARWLLAAVEHGPGGPLVGFASRALSLRFTGTEVARFSSVLQLVALAAARVPSAAA